MRTDIPIAAISALGTPLIMTMADTQNGHTLSLDQGRLILCIFNNDNEDHTANFYITKTVHDVSIGNQVVTIPAMTGMLFSEFELDDFDQGDGTMFLDVSSNLMTLAAVAVY